MKPLTIYLLTVEQGDYHTYPVTIQAYTSNGPTSPLQKLMRRLDAHYKRKPTDLPADDPDWYEKLQAWEKRHPLRNHSHRDREDFKVQPMRLR